MAYITPPEQRETFRVFRQRVHTILYSIALANKNARDIRVVQVQPDNPWSTVWQNLHAVWTSEDVKAVWYTVVHDIIPTNDRLAKIRPCA